MANGSPDQTRSSGLFSGLLLISIGVLLLLWTYFHIGVGSFLRHWWPLIFIVWGLVKFYERTVAHRQGRGTGWITAGEIFLVVGAFCLIGVVVIVDLVRKRIHEKGGWVHGIGVGIGNRFPFDLHLPPLVVPANAHIAITLPRADLSVHASDENQLAVTGKKQIRSWNEDEAARSADRLKLEVKKDGDTFVVRPSDSAQDIGGARLGLHLALPEKAELSVQNQK